MTSRPISTPSSELVAVGRASGGGLDLGAVLDDLGRRDVVRLLCEGGPTLLGALLDAGHADRAAVFVAPRIVGDAEAPALAAGRGVTRIAEARGMVHPQIKRCGRDVLFEGELSRPEPPEA